jgi:ABC-2 type transport system ATP-binding protein
MSEFVIETKGISRTFKSYKKEEGIINSIKGLFSREYIERVALKPTDMQIGSSQIIGLVGANGAGKTTLLKLLSGLIQPSSGTARVLGFDPSLRQSEYLRKISILLGQKNQLWWDIAPADSFALLAKIYDLDTAKAKLRSQELAEMLRCQHVLTTQLRRLSLGERMKMELIGALLHEPQVLFLDEPTIGLDIVAQNSVRDFLESYVADKGPTVILTSHYMDDIARLADKLFLISQGAIVYQGTVEGFMQKSDLEQKINFRIQSPLKDSVQISNKYNLSGGQQDFEVIIQSKDLSSFLSEIAGLGLSDLKIEEADFENVIHGFLQTESRIL